MYCSIDTYMLVMLVKNQLIPGISHHYDLKIGIMGFSFLFKNDTRRHDDRKLDFVFAPMLE